MGFFYDIHVLQQQLDQFLPRFSAQQSHKVESMLNFDGLDNFARFPCIVYQTTSDKLAIFL